MCVGDCSARLRTAFGLAAMMCVVAKAPATAPAFAQGLGVQAPTPPATPRPPREGSPGTPSPSDIAHGSEPVPPPFQGLPVRIVRVSQPPRVEDFINGDQQEPGTRVTGFRQRSPHDGRAVSEDTSVYLSYDEKTLYAVFVCRDDPRNVRAHLANREDIDLDDNVAVYLDTFHDRRRAYVFSANPLGIQRDGIITEGQDADYNFDAVWYSEGRVTADGFVVRIAIPFKSLRFRNEPAQTWGLGLERLFVRTGEDAYWPYITDRIEGFVPQLAPIIGPEDVLPLRHLELIPYGSFTGSRLFDRDAPGFLTTNQGRAGLDSKIILNNAFAWDISLNPDFGEVESDDPQLLVNQRFQVFFPEKRPFFLENAAFFQTPEMLFFSRHVADPEFAARLTGKSAGWAVGGLISDDRAPDQEAPTDTATGSRAVVGAFRIQREIGKESTIGALMTTRDVGSSFNNVVSVDTRLKLSQTWVFSGQAIASFDREPDGTSLRGPAYLASLSRTGRHLAFSSSYVDRSPEFSAPLGFIQRVDIRQTNNSASYSWRPEGDVILAYGPTVMASAVWNHLGNLQDWSGVADWSVSLKGQSEVKVSRAEYEESIGLQHLRQHSTLASFRTSPVRWIHLFVSYNQGTGANYSPPKGVLPSVGEVRDASFGITLRPSLRFRFDETYLYSNLDAGSASPPTVRVSVYTNHITRSKVNYQLTRPLSLRVILDYNSLLPNPSLVAHQQARHLTGDMLLTFLVNPGTALYIGYNNQYDNLEIQSTTPPRVGVTGYPSMSTGRQFYVKMSYLLR